MRARLCGAVHRLALLRLGAAFGSWASLAEAQRLRRLHLDSLLQRVSPHPVMCSVDIFLRKQEAGTCVTGHLWLSRLARFAYCNCKMPILQGMVDMLRYLFNA